MILPLGFSSSAEGKLKILIAGNEGYIGSRLSPWLSSRGHRVSGLDTGFYRDGCLYQDPIEMPYAPSTYFRDIRAVTPHDLEGFDGVVHLGELSNDPLGQNNPALTFRINHEGSVKLATAAKSAGVRRFVYASSCSVYGVGTGEFLDETAALNPQTAYASCKVLVERALAELNDSRFTVVVFRNATAYGPSPRMRFDIVLNDLCASAWTARRIAMTSDGSPWRPLVHVEDICEAIRCALEAPADSVSGRVFNVGKIGENYRVREIAEAVARELPGCEVVVGPPAADNRSYRVSFEKIAVGLPGFVARWTAQQGAAELFRLFERIQLGPAGYAYRAYTRLKQLTYLQDTKQVDADLFWLPR